MAIWEGYQSQVPALDTLFLVMFPRHYLEIGHGHFRPVCSGLPCIILTLKHWHEPPNLLQSKLNIRWVLFTERIRFSSCHILNSRKITPKTLCYFCFTLHRTLFRSVIGHGEQGSSNSTVKFNYSSSKTRYFKIMFRVPPRTQYLARQKKIFKFQMQNPRTVHNPIAFVCLRILNLFHVFRTRPDRT